MDRRRRDLLVIGCGAIAFLSAIIAFAGPVEGRLELGVSALAVVVGVVAITILVSVPIDS